MDIWDLLGISPTNDIKQIKKAYSVKLKIYHPEEHPEMFSKLNEAYNFAISYAKGNSVIQQNSSYIQTNNPFSSQLENDIFQKTDDIKDENSNENSEYSNVIMNSISDYMSSCYFEIDKIIANFELEARQVSIYNKTQRIDNLLQTEGFNQYKDHPYMLQKLVEFLKNNYSISQKVFAEVYYAYDFYETEDCLDKGIYQELFSAMEPFVIQQNSTQYMELRAVRMDKLQKNAKIARLVGILFLIYIVCALSFLSDVLVGLAIVVGLPLMLAVFGVYKTLKKLKARYKTKTKINFVTILLAITLLASIAVVVFGVFIVIMVIFFGW